MAKNLTVFINALLEGGLSVSPVYEVAFTVNNPLVAQVLSPEPSTLDPPPSTLNPQPSTLNPQPSTRNPQPQPYTLNSQPSTLKPQPSTLNPQPSTLNFHPQALPAIFIESRVSIELIDIVYPGADFIPGEVYVVGGGGYDFI